MKEDLEILEDMIESYKECFADYNMCVDVGMRLKDLQAIENLIARYKELEEENKNYKIINETLNNSYNSLEKTQKFLNVQFKKINTEIQDLCIPKSKVKEKIEELDKEYNERNSKEEDFNYNYGEEYAFAEEKLKELLKD